VIVLAPELPDGPVTNAGNSLLQYGAVGAMCVLLIIAIVWLVVKWNKANELRIKDQKEAASTFREMAQASANLVVELKEALNELVGTTDALNEAVKANTEASKTMERTLNEVVREAVRATGYRRFTPPSGSSAGGSAPGGAPVPRGGA